MKKSVIIILISLAVIVLIGIVLFVLQNKYHFLSSKTAKDIIKIKEEKTIEGKRLIIKDKFEFNKIVRFDFENNIVSRIQVYEQFGNKSKYEQAKESYNNLSNVNVLQQNDDQMYIFIEKNDFGSDTNLSYKEIYDKYLVQIIDAYELIQ